MAIDAKAAIAKLENVRVIRVGQDLFIEKIDPRVDLHQELRDADEDC